MNNKLFLEFDNYVKKFDLKNEKIDERYKHSYRVYEYAKIIANSLKLTKEDITLAMMCGLLHDIGRFEQIDKYDELWDYKIDHGDKGYEVLKENNFISKFTDKEDEQEIILFATKNHNKYNVEETNDERKKLFANIIRDADKLDIMIFQGKILDEDNKINKKLVEEIKEHKMCNNQNVHSDLDSILKFLSFVFDINYKRSFEILLENNFVENEINILKENVEEENQEVVDEVKKIIVNYIKERLEC